MTGKHIVSLGDIVVDLIFPVTLPIVAFQHQDIAGGKIEPVGACNFMIAASRIGMKVSAVGAVGADAFGATLLETLRAEGIDTSGVDASPGSNSTLVLVLTDTTKHQHTFVGAYGDGPAAAYTKTVDGIIRSADALLVMGYTLYERRMETLAVEAINHAKMHGIPVCLDAGPTLHAVTSEKIDWAITKADIILMTEEEVAGVSGNRRGDAAFKYLLDQGAKTLVIKQGERGCTVIQRGLRHQVPGFEVPVLDTVGAGDCFDAAFITAILNGHDPKQAAVMANAMGAASVQKIGAGRAVPTRAEVNAILTGTGLSY
ncbi:MAG: carbohydrate kinase family protein [Anaerolineae bacterium]